jgi:hypothetical protein
MRIIDIARTLGPSYNAPHCNEISGNLLSKLYDFNWDKQMSSILMEAKIFGVTVFGDGATIKSFPLVNVLAAGVNNPFALLDIADCTDHCSSGGKKDAPYIAGLVDPWIVKMESEVDAMKQRHTGIVDLFFFMVPVMFRMLVTFLLIPTHAYQLVMVQSMLSPFFSQMCLKM